MKETAPKQIAEVQTKRVPGKPFQKGHDPRRNEHGRPPRRSMTAHLTEALTDDARKKIADRVVTAAKTGDLRAIEFVFQRIDGNVAQKIDISLVIRKIAESQGIAPDDPRVTAAIAEVERHLAEVRVG